MVYYFLFITLKNILSLVFYFKDILQHFRFVNSWIGEFVVSFFDVTNRLLLVYNIFTFQITPNEFGEENSSNIGLEPYQSISGKIEPTYLFKFIELSGITNLVRKIRAIWSPTKPHGAKMSCWVGSDLMRKIELN